MKMLKSFGCSFIFGSDLAKEQMLPSLASRHTWPAHVAQHFGYEYGCYARPGIGNLQILEKVIRQLSLKHNDFFIIGWTWSDRFDYFDSQRQTWASLLPTDESDVAKTYFKHMHSEYRDKFTTLTCIKTAIDMLKQNSVPFLMTYMDDTLLCQQWNTSPALKYLQDYCRPYMTTFEGKNFLDWSRQNGYAESDAWHPLEQAHRAAADLMIKVFDKQNKDALALQVLS